MAEETLGRPRRSFWIISGAALVWNLIGMAAYVAYVTKSEEVIAAMPEAERAMYDNPEWVTAVFATAVTAGTIGSILLLLRRGWAVPVLALSLIAVVVQLIHLFTMSNAMQVAGAQSAVMPLLVTVVAAYLVWYARAAKAKDWLS